VTRVRRPNAAHPAAIVGPVQPADELGADASAQHAPAVEAQALAGDDQHDAEILRRRPVEKSPTRSAATSVMPCRSSETCGTSLPRPRARAMSRSKL
jgi:hypothetical protein